MRQEKSIWSILKQDSSANILFLTTFLDDEYIVQALHLGAKGYILKQNFERTRQAACGRAAAAFPEQSLNSFVPCPRSERAALHMQGMSGLEAAGTILKQDSSANILFLTTFLDDEYIVKCSSAEPLSEIASWYSSGCCRSVMEMAVALLCLAILESASFTTEIKQWQQDYEIHVATLKERNRIAREIHDNVGHMLSRSILQAGALSACDIGKRFFYNGNKTVFYGSGHGKTDIVIQSELISRKIFQNLPNAVF